MLTSETATAALDVLREEAKQLSDAAVKEKSTSEFEIPEQIQGKDHAFAIYSDGACRGNPGPGSFAFIVQDSKGAILKSNAVAFEQTTNNRMELMGAIAALEEFSVSPMHELYIFTDSKYMVDGMKSWVSGWKKRGWKKADKKEPENLDLWKKLDALAASVNVSFHWVKGHSGHPQNEYVDQLANEVLDANGY
ncbi:MAG: ribonuclease HI [Halobacteriovoraceae bacterium]|nr:ribonuclease HI [Halobacteriovoraceae bacterium]